MTNWRSYGRIPESIFRAELAAVDSPMAREVEPILQAAGEHSALMTAMCKEESNLATAFNLNVATNRNPLNLRPRGGSGYLKFASYTDCIKEWVSRITDPAYAYADTVTVLDLVRVYAPATDSNNPEAYAANVLARFDRWGIVPKETTMSDTIVFGNVPDPGIVQMICAKPYDGAGFTRVAPRKPVGVCEHITAGRGSAKWYSDFFATGGERQYDALVDFVVDRTGTIGMLNDPWGTRSPWANGRTDGLEGDGPAFLAKFGINGVNDRLISIEHEGQPADVWPKAQWEASVKLTAYLYDRMKVRWDSFPVHQDHGVVTHMLHSEFTGKGGNGIDECPGRFLKGKITAFQSEVRALLKFHQTGDVAPADPLPKPDPISIYPAGMDLGIAKTLFGKLRKHTPGNPVTEHGFDPKGGVSLAWLQRGASEGAYPQGGDWYVYDGERELIVFENGWALWRPTKRAGWRWIGDAAQAAKAA